MRPTCANALATRQAETPMTSLDLALVSCSDTLGGWSRNSPVIPALQHDAPDQPAKSRTPPCPVKGDGHRESKDAVALIRRVGHDLVERNEWPDEECNRKPEHKREVTEGNTVA